MSSPHRIFFIYSIISVIYTLLVLYLYLCHRLEKKKEKKEKGDTRIFATGRRGTATVLRKMMFTLLTLPKPHHKDLVGQKNKGQLVAFFSSHRHPYIINKSICRTLFSSDIYGYGTSHQLNSKVKQVCDILIFCFIVTPLLCCTTFLYRRRRGLVNPGNG